MKPTLDQLLVRYVQTRDEVTRLRAERFACVCDFEEVSDFSLPNGCRPPLRTRILYAEAGEHTEGKHPGSALTAACWRHVCVDVGDGETGAIGDWSEEGWCEPCKRRQVLHVELRAAMRQRTARLGGLIAATRARLMPPRPKKAPPTPPAAPRSEPSPIADDDCPF